MNDYTFAIVDIETTGGKFLYDRVIEIGILRIEKGKLVKTYKAIINPEATLPYYISELTGINAEELENAPTFSQVKDEILEILKDAVFVAHNARFDYGFLKQEFKRLHVHFQARCLCTVKLSRALFPGHSSHNLDSLIARHNFTIANRHRAYDDADVLWQFLQMAQKDLNNNRLEAEIKKILKHTTLPPQLPPETMASLPESPGVYIFHDSNGGVLYVGKSLNIKDRVLSHFSETLSSSKEMRIHEQIAAIDFRVTSGELGALLLESVLIKEMQPMYNRMLRRTKRLLILKQDCDKNGCYRAILTKYEEIRPEDLKDILGIFRSERQAKTYLADLVKEYQLCEKILQLDKNPGPCFAYQLHRCKGICVGDEDVQHYNLRFIEAFQKKKIRTWPYRGPIMIEEKRSGGEGHCYFIDQWCLLGSAIYDETSDVQSNHEKKLFDYDSYKILLRYLLNPINRKKVKAITYAQLPWKTGELEYERE